MEFIALRNWIFFFLPQKAYQTTWTCSQFLASLSFLSVLFAFYFKNLKDLAKLGLYGKVMFNRNYKTHKDKLKPT